MTDRRIIEAEHDLRMVRLAVAEEKAKQTQTKALAVYGRCPNYWGHPSGASFIEGFGAGAAFAFLVLTLLRTFHLF